MIDAVQSQEENFILTETLKQLLDKAEVAVKQQQSNLFKLIKNITDNDALPRAWWDSNGTLIYVNQQFANIFEDKTCTFIDKPLSEIIDDNEREKCLNLFQIAKTHVFFIKHYSKKRRAYIWLKWQRCWYDPHLKLGGGQVTIATDEEIKAELHRRNLQKR